MTSMNKPKQKPNLSELISKVIKNFPENDIIKKVEITKDINLFRLVTHLKLTAYPINDQLEEESTLIYPHQFNSKEDLLKLLESRLLILKGILSAKIKRLEKEKKQLKLF